MVWQINSCFNKTARFYQPCFIGGVAIIVSAWTLVGVLVGRGTGIPIIAAGSFFLGSFSSLAVFAIWRLVKQNKKILFFGTYVAWLVCVPLAWLGLHQGVLLIYAFIITKCCENDPYLHGTVWSALGDLTGGTLTPMIFGGLLAYISMWLSKNLESAKLLRRVAQVITRLSLVILGFLILIAFTSILR